MFKFRKDIEGLGNQVKEFGLHLWGQWQATWMAMASQILSKKDILSQSFKKINLVVKAYFQGVDEVETQDRLFRGSLK